MSANTDPKPRDVFEACAVVWTRDKVCRQRGWQLTEPRPVERHRSSWVWHVCRVGGR
jgi:hypothetical protein